jgi:hypothetical protein
MVEAIFGLLGVVVGAAITSGAELFNARSRDRRALRTAARAAVEELQRAGSVAEVALASDVVGPRYYGEMEGLNLDDPIARIRELGTFEEWQALDRARRQYAFVLRMGQSDGLSAEHRGLLQDLRDLADEATTVLEKHTD